jgi:NAD(P)-dependent dehydrogenase (short-subunit alcohol dehydrogenase family)
MHQDLAGKKLLVVGGTSGMGLETARRVLSRGGGVVAIGHRSEKCEAALAELTRLGPAATIAADIGRSDGQAGSDHVPAV